MSFLAEVSALLLLFSVCLFCYGVSHNLTVEYLSGFCIERPRQQGAECRKHR